PLARGVILGVLGEIAVLARLRDRADDGRALDRLQLLQLFYQTAIAVGGHRDLVHRSRFRNAKTTPRARSFRLTNQMVNTNGRLTGTSTRQAQIIRQSKR